LKDTPSRVSALVVVVSISPGVKVRAEALHRLTGSQVRDKFSEHVLTDDTHWRETYATGGKLLVEKMGRGTSTGSWRTDNDLLCRKRPTSWTSAAPSGLPVTGWSCVIQNTRRSRVSSAEGSLQPPTRCPHPGWTGSLAAGAPVRWKPAPPFP